MPFDAVFFDSGGTIYRPTAPGAGPEGTSEPEVHARRGLRLALALAGLGYKVSLDAVESVLPELERACPGRYGPAYTYLDLVREVAESLHLPLRPEERLPPTDAYVGPRYRWWLFPGTEETLAALTRAGLHVGLISNTYIPGFCADRTLLGVGLLGYFKTRIYSGQEGVCKPDPGIFRLAARRAGVEGKRILYVGDSVEKDIRPAKALGWKAALNCSSVPNSGGLADFEFTEMPRLLKWVLAD